MPRETPYCVVFITAANAEEADRISAALVQDRLAACVNTAPKIRSRYRWQGKVETASESLLIVKTRRALLPKLIRRVKEAHSYGVPEVIAFPIIAGNPDYLDWIGDSVA